jgi:hypothetical protein
LVMRAMIGLMTTAGRYTTIIPYTIIDSYVDLLIWHSVCAVCAESAMVVTSIYAPSIMMILPLFD